MNNLNKLSLPTTIIVASLVLGSFFYATQVSKQRSIERQQDLSLQADSQQQALRNAFEDLKVKQEECKSLSPGVTKRWNNIIGVTYDNVYWEECVVTYTDPETGSINTSPLRLMQTTK